MIKLKKQSLQEFQKLTSRMKPNTLLPSLRYLKLELIEGKNLVTKSNIGLTCLAEIDGAYDKSYETLLLDERILFAFIADSQGDEVIIRIGDKLINLSDGVNNINLPKDDASNYPKMPSPVEEASYVITKDHIAAIRIARKFVNDSESAGNFQFIHLYPNYIAAFNTHFFYVNNKFDDLPEAMLSPEQADVVGTFEQDLQFEATDNHYFFISPTVKYIFTRMEGSSLDVSNVVDRLKLDGKNFTLLRPELVNFCSIANVVSETAITDCTLMPPNKLKMVDANFSRAFQRDITTTGKFDEFSFNARIVTEPIRVIPFDQLQCKTVQNCLIITGDEEWYCFMGMQKQGN